MTRYTSKDIASVITIGFYNDMNQPITAREFSMKDGTELCALSYYEKGTMFSKLISNELFDSIRDGAKKSCMYFVDFRGVTYMYSLHVSRETKRQIVRR